MTDNVMNEILKIAEDSGMKTESIVKIEQNKSSLDIDLRIVYDILHSLENVEAVLRTHKLDKELSPYATYCGNTFVERTYIKECNNIKQYLKGIRDRIRKNIEILGDK